MWEPYKADYSNPDGSVGLAGIYFGYNHDLENALVVGIDTDITLSRSDDNGNFYYSDGTPYSGIYDSNLAVEWMGALRGRLGYTTGQWMPYIAAGPAMA